MLQYYRISMLAQENCIFNLFLSYYYYLAFYIVFLENALCIITNKVYIKFDHDKDKFK